jgi:hypothetical protein
MTETTTMIRVPIPLRDRIRTLAQHNHTTFGDVIGHGLDLMERERLWDEIAAIEPDQAYLDEFAAWDSDDAESAE